MGWNISSLLLDLFYFPDSRWMIEWLSSGCCLPSVIFFFFFCKSHENTAHSHVTKKQSSTWEVSWSVKLESLPRPSFCDFYFGKWFDELNHFLLWSFFFPFSYRHGGPCRLYPQITCLPCVTYNAHLLNVSSFFLGENSQHLISMCICDLFAFLVCARVWMWKFLNTALKFGSRVGIPVVDEVRGVVWIWTECTDCV